MEQILFCKSFSFRTVHLTGFRHTDNSGGCPCHYIARMHSGRGTVRTVDGEELQLRAGDIFYLPMGLKYHSYWDREEGDGGSVCWESYGFTHMPVKSEDCYAMQKIDPSFEAVQWLDRLEQDQKISPATVGYLYLFLSEVLPSLRVVTQDPKEAMLKRAMSYIKEHGDFTVPKLARALGISESGTYSFFRNYVHTTPIEIKHRLIAKNATALLTNTDMTVEQIASALGLCSSAYLRKILKKQTGCTPLKIRQGVESI